MTEPRRLAELGSDAPDALRSLLRAGREDLPDAARLQGLATRLGPVLGAAVAIPLAGEVGPGVGPELPAPDPSAATTTAAGSGAVVKALVAGTAIAALVGGAWLLTRRGPVAPAAPARSAPALEPPPASQPAPEPRAGASVPDPAPAPVEATPEQPPAKPSETARTPATGPSESALLAQAQAALSENPARALALTREHKRRFPNGALSQEREVIAIEALKRSGDPDAARKRAKDFEDRYPGSAHRRKVQNATKP